MINKTIFGIISVILLVSLSFADTVSVDIHPGWNLVKNLPTKYLTNECSSLSGPNNLCKENIEAVFAYYPQLESSHSEDNYFQVFPFGVDALTSSERQKITDMFFQYESPEDVSYTHHNAVWVLSDASSVKKIHYDTEDYYFEKPQRKKKTVLYKGWNLVTIMPYMVGRNINELSGNCKINSAHYFDVAKNDYVEIKNSNFVFENKHVAYGTALNIDNNCVFGGDLDPQLGYVAPTPANDSIVGSSFIVNVSSIDANIESITVDLFNSTNLVKTHKCSNAANCEAEFTKLNEIDDGAYYFNATVVNKAGLETSLARRTVYIDNHNPVVEFTLETPRNGASVRGSNLTVVVRSVDGNLKETQIILYDSSMNQIRSHKCDLIRVCSNIFTNLEKGKYFFKAVAYDKAGHTSSTELREITMVAVPPFPDFPGGDPLPKTSDPRFIHPVERKPSTLE